MLSKTPKLHAWASCHFLVLILVLMEYALEGAYRRRTTRARLCLNPCFNGICSRRGLQVWTWAQKMSVLILVLMEYALEVQRRVYANQWGCLNPCSNGICSRSPNISEGNNISVVLILVLMEYALEGREYGVHQHQSSVLILVLMEYALEGYYPVCREK